MSTCKCIYIDTTLSLQVRVSNPSNEGFDSAVRLRFSKGSPLPQTTINMHDTYINWKGGDSGGGKMVKLTHSHQIEATTHDQWLRSRATIVDAQVFSNFNLFAVGAGELLWGMNGHARVHALIDVEVELDKTVAMHGFDAFSIPPVIRDVSVVGGSTSELFSVANTVITSQSNMALQFGQPLSFQLKSNDITIGVGTIPDATLSTGEFSSSSNVAMSWRTVEEYEELMTVLGRFMMGEPSVVSLEHFYLNHSVDWLAPGLDAIIMSSSLPGVREPLVAQINMFVSLLHLINVPFTLDLFNAVDTAVELQAISCKIFFEDTHIADVDEKHIGFTIPARTAVVSPRFSARSDLKHTSKLVALVKAGFGYLDLQCSMLTVVGEFPVQAVYNQKQVPSYLDDED